MKYGFFSKEHEAFVGSVVYKRPNGKKVHITALSDDSSYGTDPKRYGVWKDVVCVGEVTEYVTEGRQPATLNEKFEPISGDALDKQYEFA